MTQEEVNLKLLSAVKEGNLGKVKEALEQGADINVDSGSYKDTTLIQATNSGHIEIAKYLVEQGANINAATEDGATALIVAVMSSNLEFVRFLVEQGADIEASSLSFGTPLVQAAKRCNLKITKYLVEQGANINAATEDGETALIVAVMSSNLEFVRFFVEQGADIEASSLSFGTPLVQAAKRCNLKITEYLLEQGANLNKEGLDWSVLINCAKEATNYFIFAFILNVRYRDLEDIFSESGCSSLEGLFEKSWAFVDGVELARPEEARLIASYKIAADINRLSILWTKAMFNSELQQNILKDLLQIKSTIQKLDLDISNKDVLDKMCELAFNFKEGQEDHIESSPASLKLIAAQSAFKKAFNKHELHSSEDIRKSPLSSLLKEFTAPFEKTKLGHEIDVLASYDTDCKAEAYMIEGYYDAAHKMLGDHYQTVSCAA